MDRPGLASWGHRPGVRMGDSARLHRSRTRDPDDVGRDCVDLGRLRTQRGTLRVRRRSRAGSRRAVPARRGRSPGSTAPGGCRAGALCALCGARSGCCCRSRPRRRARKLLGCRGVPGLGAGRPRRGARPRHVLGPSPAVDAGRSTARTGPDGRPAGRGGVSTGHRRQARGAAPARRRDLCRSLGTRYTGQARASRAHRSTHGRVGRG